MVSIRILVSTSTSLVWLKKHCLLEGLGFCHDISSRKVLVVLVHYTMPYCRDNRGPQKQYW